MNIQGKVAILTGAASGIGRATVKALDAKGVKAVLIVDVDEAGLESLAAELKCEAHRMKLDLTKSASIEDMYREADKVFGAIDIVFNNAGIVSGPPPYPDTPLERIRQVIALDLVAVVQSTGLAIKYMSERTGGVVVNTASTGGLQPLPSDVAYAAAKAGVVHTATSCASYAETHNVRVNAVCPGVTETPILEHTGGGMRPEWLGPILEQIEILTPDDIANVVISIIEDDRMAGQHVVVANEEKAA